MPRGTVADDFLYLPIDFQSKCHVGYAFVNLIEPQHAAQFIAVFSGFNDWQPKRGHRICVVSWGSIQGFQANVERFKTKQLTMGSVPEEYKPVLFVDGVQTSLGEA